MKKLLFVLVMAVAVLSSCATTQFSAEIDGTTALHAAIRVGANKPLEGSACCRIEVGDQTLQKLTADFNWYCEIRNVFTQPQQFGNKALSKYCEGATTTFTVAVPAATPTP